MFTLKLILFYELLAARPAFGGPLASQGATPPGPPFDSMPVSWMKSSYYNKNFILSPIIKKKKKKCHNRPHWHLILEYSR